MYAGRMTAMVLMLFGLLVLMPVLSNADEEEDDVGEIVTNQADRLKVFGGCDEDPYAALWREGFVANGAKVVPQKAGNSLIDGIDPALACRMLKLFRAAKSCSPRITDGYRSRSDQARACTGVCGNPSGCSKRQGYKGNCAPPGSSCHQYGRAVDIQSRCAEQMSASARRYGLISRIPGYPNPNHYQCLEHGRSAGASSCNRPCDGGVAITPGPDNFQPVGAPSSGITGAARDLLGQREQMCALPDGMQVPCSSIANRGAQQQQPLAQGQQPQLQQAPPLGSQNTTPYAPGTCPPQFYCANSTYYYRSSSCVDQVYQKCPTGCSASANACASTSTSSSLSAIDQIGLIAEPTTTPTGAVSDLLFELSISGEDIATLQDKTTQSAPLPGDTSYGAAPPLWQQTFVSGDLRYSQAEAYQPQRSAFLRMLNAMKETLLRALAYLRPFGRPAPVEGEYDEWAE